MKTVTCLASTFLVLLAGTVRADLCQFGYADAVGVGDTPLVGWAAAQSAGVPQDSGRIISLDGIVEAHTRNITSYISAMNAAGIRPLVDLTDVLFKAAATINPTCSTEYERGGLRNTTAWPRQQFKPGMTSKLDSFLALNASELGTESIRGFIVHVEANNNCVPAWRINTAAQALIDRGYGSADGYILAAGYGLTYEPGAAFISVGMPLNAFPHKLTHATPWAYDVHTLQANSVYNLNVEVSQLGVAAFWNKLVGKLSPSQQVIWGMTALCTPTQQEMFNGSHLPPQDRLGTQCTTAPFQGTWPIGSIANQWRLFAEQQARMDGLIAILWTGPAGTNALAPSVTSAHVAIGNSALTCD